jgi:hypothetical protein
LEGNKVINLPWRKEEEEEEVLDEDRRLETSF